MSQVKIFRCALNPEILSVPIPDAVADLFPEDFCSRAESRRISYYSGRLMLLSVLSRFYGVSRLSNTDICFSEHGKPYFSRSFYLRTGIDVKIFFNLSHSGDTLYLCVSDSETSIDAERIRPRKTMHDLAGKYFSSDENDIMSASPDGGLITFYHLWTIRETLVKHSGKGIADMTGFRFVRSAEASDFIGNLRALLNGAGADTGLSSSSKVLSEIDDETVIMDIEPVREGAGSGSEGIIVTFDVMTGVAGNALADRYSLSVYLDNLEDLPQLGFYDVIMPSSKGESPVFLSGEHRFHVPFISRISRGG